MRIQRGILFGGLFIFLFASRTFGQTTFATLTGIVTDSPGGVVPGAIVEARHVHSNYTYTTTTNEVGHYTLGQLREGEYVLRVQIPGFKEFIAQNIQLAAKNDTLEVFAGAEPPKQRVIRTRTFAENIGALSAYLAPHAPPR